MPTIETNGFETYYERHGGGPPIVFSHGSGWDHRSWLPQAVGLAPDYEVICYDVRGHGRTGRTGASLDALDELADDLHALVDALELDSPIVGGCSMGGRIAYEYAARYPEATDGAILLEAPITVTDPPLGMRLFQKVGIGLIATIGPKRSYDVLQLLRSIRGSDDPYADRYVPGIGMRKADYIDDAAAMMDADEQLELMRAERRSIDLSALTAPALVLTGDDPAERYADSADVLVERISETTRRQIPDAGHGAHMDNPVAFNATVREFLADVTAE